MKMISSGSRTFTVETAENAKQPQQSSGRPWQDAVTGDVMLSKPDGLMGLIFRLGANIEAPQRFIRGARSAEGRNARCRRVGAAEFLRDTEDTSCLMPAERRAVTSVWRSGAK